MNRKRRKAAKMFKRRYGRATNPHWQSQGIQVHNPDVLRASLRQIYNAATFGTALPVCAFATGEFINRALDESIYEPGRLYQITADGIIPA